MENTQNNQKVIVYSTPVCPYCHMAKDYLKEQGVAFEEKDVARDVSARTEMYQKTGQLGVPVILVGDEAIVGFDKPRLSALIKSK